MGGMQQRQHSRVPRVTLPLELEATKHRRLKPGARRPPAAANPGAAHAAFRPPRRLDEPPLIVFSNDTDAAAGLLQQQQGAEPAAVTPRGLGQEPAGAAGLEVPPAEEPPGILPQPILVRKQAAMRAWRHAALPIGSAPEAGSAADNGVVPLAEEPSIVEANSGDGHVGLPRAEACLPERTAAAEEDDRRRRRESHQWIQQVAAESAAMCAALVGSSSSDDRAASQQQSSEQPPAAAAAAEGLARQRPDTRRRASHEWILEAAQQAAELRSAVAGPHSSSSDEPGQGPEQQTGPATAVMPGASSIRGDSLQADDCAPANGNEDARPEEGEGPLAAWHELQAEEQLAELAHADVSMHGSSSDDIEIDLGTQETDSPGLDRRRPAKRVVGDSVATRAEVDALAAGGTREASQSSQQQVHASVDAGQEASPAQASQPAADAGPSHAAAAAPSSSGGTPALNLRISLTGSSAGRTPDSSARGAVGCAAHAPEVLHNALPSQPGDDDAAASLAHPQALHFTPFAGTSPLAGADAVGASPLACSFTQRSHPQPAPPPAAQQGEQDEQAAGGSVGTGIVAQEHSCSDAEPSGNSAAAAGTPRESSAAQQEPSSSAHGVEAGQGLTCWRLRERPPSMTELDASADELGVPRVVHQPAFYGRKEDVPERPTGN